MDWVTLFCEYLLPPLGSLLAALACWAVWKLKQKLGVEASFIQDQQVFAVVDQAVQAVEQWAANKPVKPLGTSKADMALGVVRGVLSNKDFQAYTEPVIKQLVEAGVARLKATRGEIKSPEA